MLYVSLHASYQDGLIQWVEGVDVEGSVRCSWSLRSASRPGVTLVHDL